MILLRLFYLKLFAVEIKIPPRAESLVSDHTIPTEILPLGVKYIDSKKSFFYGVYHVY
jgi:hypothetical protein